MADPTELNLTTAEAAALQGTTAADVLVVYPTASANYVTTGIEERARWHRMLGAIKGLRVVKVADMACGVVSGEFMDGPNVITFDGDATEALTNDTALNYIYLTPAGVLTINTTGWPAAAHVPLATIATGTQSAAAVTGEYNEEDITDFRARALFSTIGEPVVKKLISQSLAFGDFTDNGDATGYIDFDTDTPATIMVVGWQAVVSTGFTGDTTAVIEVGVSGDTDAFSADTAQSVLAAATVGSAPLAAESYRVAATTTRVTVTGGADFGSISAGVMIVTLFYIELPQGTP